MQNNESSIDRAAEFIAGADGLLITAGAGMGVDSGLPDFRGTEGFWRAYPALARAGIAFEDIADPAHFRADPQLAWGFYGHRLNLYRATVPHAGFAILRRWTQARPMGAFFFTSNVDGQFQKAGLRYGCEAHGSIHHLQCIDGCRDAVWPADAFHPQVDEASCRLLNEPPCCPHCGEVARPNILMFGDDRWIDRRSEGQRWELNEWLAQSFNLVAIELGAGTAIPTVRRFTERSGMPFIRINVRDPETPGRLGIGIAMGAAEALARIDERLNSTQ